MTLTILYRHRDRPDEVAMTMISTQEEVAAMVKQLEKRGFVVEKITARLDAGAATSDPS
jgi:DNA-binding MarR family transcriptional regulator